MLDGFLLQQTPFGNDHKNKIMKKIIVLSIIFLFPFLLSSQVKTKIGFIPYTDPDNAEEEYRELAYKNIYDAALRVFVNTQRFDVLDRGSFNIVKIEKEFQKGEDLANVEIIEQGKTAAAEVLAVAKLSTFTVTDSDDGNGFSVYITAEFKQIEVKTGKALRAFQLRSEVVDKQENAFGMTNKKRVSTVEEAISRAVIGMEKDLEKWIKSEFPMILKVRDIQSNKKIIVVDGGKSDGLSKRLKMKVIKLTIYDDGNKLTEDIANLSFSKNGIGEDLTTLKVRKKDWAAFMELWKKSPESLYVTEDL